VHLRAKNRSRGTIESYLTCGTALCDWLDGEPYGVTRTDVTARPTARATLSAGVAGWLAQFVDGQALDSYDDEITGVAHTISDVAQWRIDTEERAGSSTCPN